MNISFDQFLVMWNKRCIRAFGLGYEDLPDILCIDDHWYDGMTQQEAKSALDDMEEELRQEFEN